MQKISEIEKLDMYDLLPPDEGSINQIYGRIGSGKTYCATEDLLNDLNSGQIVYANWKVNWEGYDQRKNWFYLFLGMLGLKKEFWVYPKTNFRFLPIDENFHDTFGRLTDCAVYLDEGHLAYDSYKLTKMTMQERANILHTRHFDRKVVIVSQRPTAIHVTLRDNVNRFFKCERIFKFGWLIIFRKTEFQDFTVYGTIDEEQPINSEWYFGRAKIFKAYDTKYLRGNLKHSQPNLAEIWLLKYHEILELADQKLKDLFLKKV